MSSNPYVKITDKFNSSDFNTIFNDYLTQEAADALYLSKSGGFISYIDVSQYKLNGTNIDLSGLANFPSISGTVEALKLIQVDANKDINGFRNLTAINLTGTIQTAAQPNITSVGNLTSLTLNSVALTSTATELNYLHSVTPGTASVSKAVVLDASKNISSINSISTTSLTVNGTSINTSDLSLISGITPGTALASKALILDASKNISSINSISTTSLTVNGTSINTSDLALISGITPGTALASKALILDSGKTISGITSLSATSITGTLTTPAQPNITSLGTLSNLTASNTIQTNTLFYNTNSNGNVGHFVAPGPFSYYYGIGPDSTSNDYNVRIGLLSTVSGTWIGYANLAIGNAYVKGTSNSSSYTTGALTVAGGVGITGNTYINGNLYVGGQQITPASTPSQLSGVTDGIFQANKCMVLDSNTSGKFSCGNKTNHSLRFYDGTANSNRINIYRQNYTTGLTISSSCEGAANKAAPLLNLISTDDSNVGYGGMSASDYQILQMIWNDTNLTFSTKKCAFGYSVGYSRNYKSGYPGCYGLWTDADALSIGINSSYTTNPTTNCLYFVNDTYNRLLYNTDTVYTHSSFGKPHITLNKGNMYIKCTNVFNDGSSNFDTALLLQSSNSSYPVEFAFQLHNGNNTTSANGAYMGTTSNNDFIIMTNNSRKMTVTASGNVCIGTNSPVGLLTVFGYNSTTIDSLGAGVSYFLKNGGLVQTVGPITNQPISIYCSGCIWAAGNGVFTTSDKRLKENIVDLDESLISDIFNINAVSFNYKNNKDNKQIGFIAQDLIKNKLGLVVNFNKREGLKIEDPEVDTKDIEYSVDYSKLTVYLFMALKKQQREMKLLFEQQIALRADIKELKAQIRPKSQSSDRRIKENINYNNNIKIDDYLKFKPSTFNFKEGFGLESGRKKYGLIAQDLLNLCPELLGIIPDEKLGESENPFDIKGKRYTVDYQQLIIINMMMIQKIIRILAMRKSS